MGDEVERRHNRRGAGREIYAPDDLLTLSAGDRGRCISIKIERPAVTENKNTEKPPMEMQAVTPATPVYRQPQNQANTFWTAERDEKLKKLFAAGLSASVIQKDIGASSRGQVCGRINRLKLTRDAGYEVTRARLRAEREARLAAQPRRAKGSEVKAVRT